MGPQLPLVHHCCRETDSCAYTWGKERRSRGPALNTGQWGFCTYNSKGHPNGVLRDFLMAKEGISKGVGVLRCPANNVVLNYRVTKVGKEGPFRLPRGGGGCGGGRVIHRIPVLPVMSEIVPSGLQKL